MEEKVTLKDIKEMGGPQELLKKEWSPCQYACPVHADIRGYLDLISKGQFKEALEVIREVLPFPTVCGRICHHPCEGECRRKDIDKALAIRDLKRFVAEWDYGEKPARKKARQAKEKVAIIGGGPSGLTAGLDLAKMGYQPTVFEKFPSLGGMLVSAIPSYRLPRELIEKDIKEILSFGIEVKNKMEIGRDISFEDLFRKGFKAILIACGLSESRSLPLPGFDNPGVLLALPFLKASAFNNTTPTAWCCIRGGTPIEGNNKHQQIDVYRKATNVLVIGGGNVAMDVARVAIRLGADRVKAVCLESRKEMPAWEWEIEEAREEGVELIYSRGPKRIISSGKKITALEVMEVKSVFDPDGKFNPKFYEERISLIEAGTIIVAIGQKANVSFLEGAGIKLERGIPAYNKETLETEEKGVFVTGELAIGPASVVESVASGHRAASCIDAFLNGKKTPPAIIEKPKIEKIPQEILEKVPHRERQAMPTLTADVRKKDFREFELGLSLKSSLEESRRCLSCGGGAVCVSDRCIACLTCLRVCPFKVPQIKEYATISSDRCIGCGMCAPECPTKAILMKGYSIDNTKYQIKEGLGKLSGRKKILLITCGYRLYRISEFDMDDVTEVIIPAMSHLWTSDILSAFEEGASAVMIAECSEGECRYSEVTARLKKKVEEARDLLAEVGISKEKVVLKFGLTSSDEELKGILKSLISNVKEQI